MSQKPLKTNRKIRISAREERNLVFWVLGAILVLIVLAELPSNEQAHVRGQGRITYLLFMVFIYRVITFRHWAQHYRDFINFSLRAVKQDSYIVSSISHVLLDIVIVGLFLFYVEIESAKLYRIPAAAIVYLLMLGFSFFIRRKA